MLGVRSQERCHKPSIATGLQHKCVGRGGGGGVGSRVNSKFKLLVTCSLHMKKKTREVRIVVKVCTPTDLIVLNWVLDENAIIYN